MEPVILNQRNPFGSAKFASPAILATLVISLCIELVSRTFHKIAPPLVHQSHESLQSGKYKQIEKKTI